MKKSPSEQIQQADPDVVEERKWGGPVWSHDGLICTGETYKGEEVDASAFKALFREAVALNSSGKSKK